MNLFVFLESWVAIYGTVLLNYKKMSFEEWFWILFEMLKEKIKELFAL